MAVEFFTDFGSNKQNAKMIINEPGTGKTLSVVRFYLHLATFIQHKRIKQNYIRLILVSYSHTVFINQLSESSDIGYLSMNTHLTQPTREEKRSSTKLMPFNIMGFKKLASKILNIHDERAFMQYVRDNREINPVDILLEAQHLGYITINNTVLFRSKSQRCYKVSSSKHTGALLSSSP